MPGDDDIGGRLDYLEEIVLRLAAQLQALAARAKVAVVEGKPLSMEALEDARVAAQEAVRQEVKRLRESDREHEAQAILERGGAYHASVYNRLKLSLLQGDRVEVEGLLDDAAWFEEEPKLQAEAKRLMREWETRSGPLADRAEREARAPWGYRPLTIEEKKARDAAVEKARAPFADEWRRVLDAEAAADRKNFKRSKRAAIPENAVPVNGRATG